MSAAATFRAVETATASGGSSVTCTIPASTQVGDLLLLTISDLGGAATAISGWTNLLTATAGASIPFNVLRAWSRTAQSGDAGSTVTFTISGGATSAFCAAVLAYQDATEVVGDLSTSYITTASSIDTPAVTGVDESVPTTVALFGCTIAGTPTVIAPASSRVSISRFFSGGSYGCALGVSDDTSDPNAARTATCTSSSRRSAAAIVLRHTSHMKHYDGSTWALKPTYRYDGSDWRPTDMKRYDGSGWIRI